MDHRIWIEAEAFDDLGGWTADTQFMDQMGSAYLIADGLCVPVAAARHNFRAEPGTYAVWARTCDWLPEYSPGRFCLEINGIPGRMLGASGQPGWRWEKAGAWTLNGETALTLRDDTGAYGRVDAFLLTADMDFVPGEAQTEALRDALRMQREIPRSDYDVVVVGGGLAGCTAAVAAARNGCRVALVNDRPVLGGNASTEYLIPPCGFWNADEPGTDDRVTISTLNARETGIVEEYRTSGYQRIREGMLYAGRLRAVVEGEPGIALLEGQHVRRAILREGRIQAAECVDVRTGLLSVLEAPLFIDCSGDSTLAISAGADWRQGREPFAAHGEPWAPERESSDTMGNGIKYLAMETTEEQPFHAPAWAYRFEHCEDMDPVRHPSAYGAVGRSDCTDPFAAMTHQWLVELGGNRNAFEDAESIRDELLRLVFGLWDHVKNRCPKEKERSRNMLLRWVGIFAGKRETRRLLGDAILTQNNICEDTPFEDAVAFGAWVVDDHYSDGYFHRGKAGHHYDDYTHAAYGKVYRIPLRALYSRNIPNLLMAGRNISATHLAMSNTRVMLICALMGQAAGTAAALCHRYGKNPRAVAAEHIEAVQELLLEQGAHIPGKPYLSPRNLAARAHMESEDPADHPADALLDGYNRAIGHATHAWQPKGASPYRLTLTWPETVEINFVELIFQTRDLAPERFTITGLRDGIRQCEIQSQGKRVRRETLTLDSPVLMDTLTVKLSDPAPLCQIDVRLLDESKIQITRRIQANMKQTDRVPVLPWERK